MTSTSGDGGPLPDGARSRRPAGGRPRRHRARRAIIVGLLVLSLLAVGTVAGYFAFLNWKVSNNLTYRELLPDEEILGEDRAVQPAPVQRPEAAKDARNFLLVGTDTRDPGAARGRSDVIVVVHISDDRERVDLVHLPRDYFVEIPGSDRKNKINASYSFGGAPLLVETLQPLLGVPIDEVAIVDFDSFQTMTDSIGGVDVDVAESSPRFPAGVQHMDGATGLQFVRERYALSQGDISRGQRQQAFIKAIMLKALSRQTLTNPARFASFVDAATTNLTVDDSLDLGDMRSLALSMRGVWSEDINFVTAPWSGLGDDSFAGSIVNPAPQQLEVLGEHLQNDTMASYSDPVSPTSGFGD